MFTNEKFSLYLYISSSNDCSMQLLIVSRLCLFVTDLPLFLNRKITSVKVTFPLQYLTKQLLCQLTFFEYLSGLTRFRPKQSLKISHVHSVHPFH